MPGVFADPLTARIAEFLDGIGIAVDAAELPGDSFLPGIALESGGLLVDGTRLDYPGDLLHEAGHLAAAPAWAGFGWRTCSRKARATFRLSGSVRSRCVSST